jgi:DNA polymerase-3 subunit epsilon
MGYCDLNHQINNREILEKIITPMENNKDARHLIQGYLRKNGRVRVVDL